MISIVNRAQFDPIASKRMLTLLIAVMATLCLTAQQKITKMNIWMGNEVSFQANIDKIDSITFDEIYVTTEGALKGEFSVSANKKVHFSKGNLRYYAPTNSWAFADQQYSIIGYPNINISSTYDGWIDLFGWGTSGWNSGAIAYQPYSSSVDDADYQIGGGTMNDMTGAYANADWGVYNAIANGGNKPGLWRTLTYTEWKYLISLRTNASKLRAKATVGSQPGYILLPDDWVLPEGLAFSLTPSDWDYNRNVYSLEQWETMEEAGAVFLPCTGMRHGTIEVGSWSSGYYWSATPESETKAWNVGFYYDYMGISTSSLRHCGFGVRLVQDIEDY